MARPRKEIDKSTFEGLCELQCTEEEICCFFSISDKTLSSWCKRTYGTGFSEIYAQKRKGGRISLRRTIWQMASRSAAVAIFLAKNYLGMRDDPEPELPKDEIVEDGLSKSLRELGERLRND